MKPRGFSGGRQFAFYHSPHWKSVLLVWAPGSPLTLQEPENFHQHVPEPENFPPVSLAACPEVISLFWMIKVTKGKNENVNSKYLIPVTCKLPCPCSPLCPWAPPRHPTTIPSTQTPAKNWMKKLPSSELSGKYEDGRSVEKKYKWINWPLSSFAPPWVRNHGRTPKAQIQVHPSFRPHVHCKIVPKFSSSKDSNLFVHLPGSIPKHAGDWNKESNAFRLRYADPVHDLYVLLHHLPLHQLLLLLVVAVGAHVEEWPIQRMNAVWLCRQVGLNVVGGVHSQPTLHHQLCTQQGGKQNVHHAKISQSVIQICAGSMARIHLAQFFRSMPFSWALGIMALQIYMKTWIRKVFKLWLSTNQGFGHWTLVHIQK